MDDAFEAEMGNLEAALAWEASLTKIPLSLQSKYELLLARYPLYLKIKLFQLLDTMDWQETKCEETYSVLEVIVVDSTTASDKINCFLDKLNNYNANGFLKSIIAFFSQFTSALKIEMILQLDDFLRLDSHSLVQFYHRNAAYILILYVLFLTIFIYKNKIISLYKPLYIFLFFLISQVMLGIFTLISGLNIFLASIHQVTGVVLVFSALNLYYLRTK